jgi:2-haloacid dehalogenase
MLSASFIHPTRDPRHTQEIRRRHPARRGIRRVRRRRHVVDQDRGLSPDQFSRSEFAHWCGIAAGPGGAFEGLVRLREEGVIKGGGVGVNTVEPCLRALQASDPDIFLLAGQPVAASLKRRGIELRLGSSVLGLNAAGDGVRVQTAMGEEIVLSPERVLVAADRRPDPRLAGGRARGVGTEYRLQPLGRTGRAPGRRRRHHPRPSDPGRGGAGGGTAGARTRAAYLNARTKPGRHAKGLRVQAFSSAIGGKPMPGRRSLYHAALRGMRTMKHRLFLFDLDDTLLDFKASEQLSFDRTMRALGFQTTPDGLFVRYQAVNLALWKAFELGEVSKDFLKVERFRRTFAEHGLDLDPAAASHLYLEALSDTVVLVDGAQQLCETLAGIGEVGIITNGVEHIQHRRIAASTLHAHVSFVATSEACGHAKPDRRFFDYTVNMARAFSHAETVIVGDRLDADILGANRFGIDSCWFNPGGIVNDTQALPTFEVARLQDVIPALRGIKAT